MTRPVLISVLATALAVLAVVPAAAPAAPKAGQGLGFGVTPEDSPKGYLELEATPGSTVRSALLLTNPGSEPVKVVLRRQDADSAATGGLQYEDPKSGGTGRWITAIGDAIEVPPGEGVRVPVSARIPEDARAGDHFAGLIAYNAADLARVKREESSANGRQLRFISRFAVAVRFKVPGPAQAELAAGEVSIETTPSGAALVVDLVNRGRLLIPSAKGRVTVERDGEELFSAPVDVRSSIPDSRIGYRIPWRGTPAQGIYRVTGFVHPSRGDAITIDQTVEFGRKQGERFATESGRPVPGRTGTNPWLWRIPAALAALIALGLLVALLRRRPRPAGSRTAPQRPPSFEPPPFAAQSPQAPVIPASAPFVATIIDINTATAAQLEALPGIGPAAAARIIWHRNEYGCFESIDDLIEVEGFHSDRLRRLREQAVARP